MDSDCDGSLDPVSPCFIATVAFGSPLAAEVETFRTFRDRYLATHGAGRLFVEFYETYGPGAARFIAGRPWLKGLVRGALYPAAVVCSFALEAPVWQKAAVTAVTLLLTFGIMVLISRRRGRPFAAYRKALCVLLVAVFTFDSVTLGYFGAGGGVKEARAAVPADGIYFYLNDHLGTPLKMVDEDGAVVWSADYLPFGQATVDPASTVASNWRFPGQFEDAESGLHYNLMRSYASWLGRYTRPDPVNVASVRLQESLRGLLSTPVSLNTLKVLPQLLNLYPYGLNHPLNNLDPTGLLSCDAWCRAKWQGLCPGSTITSALLVLLGGYALGLPVLLVFAVAATEELFFIMDYCSAFFEICLHQCTMEHCRR